MKQKNNGSAGLYAKNLIQQDWAVSQIAPYTIGGNQGATAAPNTGKTGLQHG